MEGLPAGVICEIVAPAVIRLEPAALNALCLCRSMRRHRADVIQWVCQYLRFYALKESAKHIVIVKHPGDLCWICMQLAEPARRDLIWESCSYPFDKPAFQGVIKAHLDYSMCSCLPMIETVTSQSRLLDRCPLLCGMTDTHLVRGYFQSLTADLQPRNEVSLENLRHDLLMTYVVLNELSRRKITIKEFPACQLLHHPCEHTLSSANAVLVMDSFLHNPMQSQGMLETVHRSQM